MKQVLNCILHGIKKVGCQVLSQWAWPLLCEFLVWRSHDPMFTFRSCDDTWASSICWEKTDAVWGSESLVRGPLSLDYLNYIFFPKVKNGNHAKVLICHITISMQLFLDYFVYFSKILKKATTPKLDCSLSVTYMRRTLTVSVG